MGSVGKFAEAGIGGVEQSARAKAYWPAWSLRAIPEFAARCVAVVVALASIAAVAMVGVFSFGLYGVAEIFGKVRPLRSAYEFLSHAYDRFIERLGEKVLRDPRDAPALRLMVSITLTALPVFVAQLVLGKPRLLLVVAFYLFLYGPKFQRFVRMFSAKHLEAHRPQNYFADGYDKVFRPLRRILPGLFVRQRSGARSHGACAPAPSRERRAGRYRHFKRVRPHQHGALPVVLG